MLGPLVEIRRHQSTHTPIQLPWDRTRTRSSCSQGVCERNTYTCREERQIAAQLEGLPERIAALESMSEK